MGLTDLFRPRHRHSNAAVRAEAVRQLGSDDADLLASIARDDRDASVRRIAIDKVDDPDVLVDIARGEAERPLRDRASGRAAEIWVTRATADELDAAKDALAGLIKLGDQKAIAEVASRTELAEIREAAMTKIDDPKALAELARNPNTPTAARTTAIGRIDNVEVLRSIAVDEKRKDVALAVLDRIDDKDALEVITAKAKSKAARTRARKKLAELAKAAVKTVPPEVKRQHAERVQLARRAEQLARGEEWTASAREMDELEQSWQALAGDNVDSELQARFERLAIATASAKKYTPRPRRDARPRRARKRLWLPRRPQAAEQAGDDAAAKIENAEATAADPAASAPRTGQTNSPRMRPKKPART